MPAPDLDAAATPPRRLRAASTLLLVVALLAAAGLRLYGLGAGGSFYFRLARAPLAPTLAGPYYRESLLHVGLAWLLGVTTSIEWFRLANLACFWAALAVLLVHARRRLGPGLAALVVLVALTHPAAMIVHAWTCHPDALLLLLTTLLIFTRRPALVAVLAALLAWTNLPMALVAGLAISLQWFGFAAPRARSRGLALLLGLALGALTCKLTLLLAGVHLERDRFAAALAHDPAELLRYWTAIGWPVVYTLHFAHLLWLPALLVTLHRHRPAAAAALLAAQALALLASAGAEDTTRVFACLAFAPLTHALIRALALLARPGAVDRAWLRPLLVLGVLLSLAAPKCFAWKGRLHDLAGAHAHLRELLP